MTNLLHIILLSLAIIGSAFFISQREVTIKDATTHPTQWGITMNSIAVVGEGKVFAQPDVFILGLSVSNIGATTAEAQQKTKQVADELTALTKGAGVAEKDIQTTEMNIYPEYEYLPNGTNRVKGYRATHGLTLKIRKLDQIDKIISEVTFDNSVQINSMSYDIDDKTDLYTQARKLGFEKAKQKADELASLAGVALDKPLSISDQIGYSNPIYPPMPYQANYAREEMAADSMGGAAPMAVNPGQLELSVTVNIVYGLK